MSVTHREYFKDKETREAVAVTQSNCPKYKVSHMADSGSLLSRNLVTK